MANADSLASISNEYSSLKNEDIEFEPIPENSFPQFSLVEIQIYDIPAIIMKECAQFLCVPVRKMINKSILVGKWAKIHQQETIQPIPKAYPPETIDILRPIANLPNINKIQETAIAEMVIKDMQDNLDPSQYGNRKHASIHHYLVKLLHRILATVDRNSRHEINAVLCSFVDWRQAYSC